MLYFLSELRPQGSKLYMVIRGHRLCARMSMGLPFNEVGLGQKMIPVIYFLMRIWTHAFFIIKFYLERIIFVRIQIYVAQTISAHIQRLEATLSTNTSS